MIERNIIQLMYNAIICIWRSSRDRALRPHPSVFVFVHETRRHESQQSGTVQNQMFAQANRRHRTNPSAQPGGTLHLHPGVFPRGVDRLL